MHSHTGCICVAFLHCMFSYVSSNDMSVRVHSRIGCICVGFPHCAFLNVSSRRLDERMHSHIGYNCLTSLHCAFLSVISKSVHGQKQSYIGYIFWLISTVNFNMSLQTALMGGFRVTLIALVWSLTLVSFCHSHRILYIGVILAEIIIINIWVHH